LFYILNIKYPTKQINAALNLPPSEGAGGRKLYLTMRRKLLVVQRWAELLEKIKRDDRCRKNQESSE